MVYAKPMTCEIAVLFPSEKELPLSKQEEQLKPALQPQLLTPRILIKKETEETQETNWLVWHKQTNAQQAIVQD